MRKFKFWMAVLTALVLVFSGCQIGLGDAVDTRTPSIAVTQPSVGDVVRDKFELKGTWGDDGEIKSLDISLKRVDIEDAVPINYSAKWEKTDEAENEHLGVWSTLIDPKQDEVKDGKYEATATIKDKAGHSYAVTRTFIIDNTPPVVVLQRPSAKGTSTMADSYGQLFTLEGQSADDNNIDLIEMYIYKDADLKEKAHTISLKNVPPTISLDVAQFGEDDYTSIYGSTEKNGEVARYCTIMAYDSAVRYPLEGEQSDEDKKGNCTDIYYLYDEVSADVLSENKITEVYQMMSGNYTADRAAATIEKVSEVLRAHEVKIGYFTLNPENNPTFTVNGKDPLKKDGTDFASEDNKITTGSNVVIEIAPGLDGIILDETTLKIKITQCDASGKKLDGATPYYPETTYKKSGTTYKFTVKLTKNPEKGFVLGQNYIIEAEGKDIGGNPVFPSNPNGYGFRLSSGGGAPVLSIESPAEGTTYLKKGSDVEVKGNVVVQEGTPDITFYINNELIKTITLDPADAIDDNGKFKFLFNYTVLAENFAQDESKEYTLKVMAAGEDSSVDKEKQISYDVDGPVLGFNEVSPIVDVLIGSETKECVNDKLLIRVSASDAYTKIKDNATKWQIEQDGEVKKSGTFGKDNSVTIDTKEAVFTDEKAAKIVISSEDVAGNTNTLTKDIYISQKTDIPVITSTNTTTLSFDVKEESSLATATTNKIAKGGILQISAKDDDGIQATYIDIFDNTGKSIFDVKNDGKYDPYSTAASTIVYTMPDEKVGHFRVVIYAEDINGYTTKGTADQKEFWIRVTGNQPTINLDKTSTWISSSYIGQIPVTISVTNEDSEFYNFYKGVIEGSNVEPTYTLLEKVPVSSSITTDYTYNFTKNDIAPGTTSQDYIYFMVEDSNGIRSGAKQFKYQIDNQSPYSDITTPGSDSTATNALSQVSYSFTGTAQDGTGSQVKAIWYKVLDKAVTAPTAPSGDSLADGTWTAAGWTKASNTDSWNFTQKFKAKDLAGDALVEGSYTAYVFAVDNAGNIGTISNRLFDVDLTAPELTVTQTQTEINASKNYSFTLSGTAGDTQELDYVLIQFDGNDAYKYSTKADKDSDSSARITNSSNTLTLNTKALDGSSTTVEATGIEWSITFAESGTGTYPLPNGRHKVTIIAVDKMGRESAAVTKTVNVDTTPPVVAVTAPASNVFSKTSAYKFEGTASDEGLGLKSVKVQLYNGSNVAQGSAEEVNVSNGKWSYTATDLADAAGYYVKVTAVDEGDNSVTSDKSNTVTVDSVAPTTTLASTGLTNENGQTATAEENGKYFAKGSFTLSGKITENYLDTIKINDVSVTPGTDGSWSKTYAASELTEGLKEYTIVLEDKAGNKSSYKVTVTYDKTAPTTTVTSNITSGFTNGSSITYSGTITETNLYQAELTLIKNGVATSTKTTVDSKNWTWKVSELEEGTYTVKAVVTDKAGNTNGTGTTGGSVVVDKTAPVTTITGTNLKDASLANASILTNGLTYYASETYSLSGAITETNLASATYQIDSNAAQTLANTWSIASQTGKHTYTFKLTDKAGNIETYTIKVEFDNVPPTVSINTPRDNIEDPNLAINSDEYSFRINATDNGGVGVSSISYAFSTSGTTAPTTGWVEDNNFGDGDKYFTMSVKEGTTAQEGKLPEGVWYLWVKAKDKSGNEGISGEGTSEAPRKLIVDKFAPTLSVTQSLNETGTNALYNEVTASGYTISGTVSDTNAMASSKAVVVKVDGEEKLATTNANWSYIIPKGTAKGTLLSDAFTQVEITATDIVGKTTTKKYTLYYDTKAPELEVSSPVENEQVENVTKVIKGTVSDEGYGLAKLEFELRDSTGTVVKDENGKEIKGSSGSTNAGNYPITIKGEQWYYGSTSATEIPLGRTEGALKLYVKATENASASRTTEKTIDFYFDKANPVIDETGIGTTGKTTNTNFTFTGTAYDTNALAKIEIKEGSTVVATTEGTTPTITCANMASAKDAASEATWEAVINSSSFADGVYTYTVVATDKAGRETKQNRTVTYDKTKPTITDSEITQTGGVTVNSNMWYKTSQIAISTKVNDNLSGIASVEYSTDKTNWYSLTKDSTDSTKWAGSVSCTKQGLNNIYIRVKDNAGNAEDNSSNPLTAYIDTVTPDTCNLISVDGDTSFTSGQKLVNGAKPVAVVLELEDNDDTANGYTGINKVQLLKSGTPSTASTAVKGTDNKWTVTIATKDLVSGGVNFRVTDNVGNYADFSPFTILKDETPPTLTITPIIDADKSTTGIQVNGKITISGIASDNQALEKVELGYNTTGGNTYTPLGTVSGTTSWSLADIDTTDITKFTENAITSTGVTVYIQAKATDKAGNEKTETTSFIIKQDTDRPVIKLTNLDLSDTNKTSTTSDEYWYKNEELMFTISDDDGAIISSAEDGENATVQISLDGGTTYNGVSFDGLGQYTISSNGSKVIYFKVTDNAGKTFTTNTASTTYATFGPKITDKTNTAVYGYTNASDVIKIKVDTQAPEISNTYYLIGTLSATDLTAPKLEDPENNGWTSLASFGSAQLGGNQTLNVLFYATDTSGIDIVSSKFAGSEVATGNTLYNEVKSDDTTTKIIVTKFDISDIESGSQPLQLKATDKAGMVSNTYERYATVDNTKPTVACSNYNDNDLVYGSSTVNVRGTVTDSSNVSKVEIAFTKDATNPTSWRDVSNNIASAYSDDPNLTTWTLLFDGTSPGIYNGAYNTMFMNNYIYDLYNVSDANRETYSTISDIYIWVRATDKFGNVSDETNVKLKVNPIADRPTLNFTYPTNQADGSLQSIGGVIRVTGTTEISDPNAYVAAVVLQIDPNYQTSFNNSWNTDLNTIISNKSVSNYSIKDTSSLWATAEDPLYGLSTEKKNEITNTVGSKIINTLGSTTSWNLTLNMKGEFGDSLGKDAENNDIYRKLGLRAYAISSTGRVTDAQIVVAQMDPASPLFGNEEELRLVQYDTDGTTEVASRKYEPGLYLSGQWYLVGTVTDTSGIKQLTLDGEDVIVDGKVETAYSSYVSKYEMDYDGDGTPDTNGYSGYYNWKLKIPVGVTTANDFGTKTYTLIAMESALEAKTSTQVVTINYDNKAPDFTATEKSEIYNSDGAARFEGTIGEDGADGKNQSGVSKVAMYFTRTLGGVTSIIDPLSAGGTNGKDNFIASTDLDSKNGLYWRSATASSISGSEIQLDNAVPDNIRPGSLVMINNVIYVIKTINFSTNIVTVKDSTLATATNQAVYFAVAQIIDNTSAEAGTTKVYVKGSADTTTNGDGDWMVESLNMSNGTSGSWYAIYDSSIIMDGPVTVHYVAFDKAGNTTSTSFNAKVMNNAPRIAGVVYGTDENGNGSVDEDELKLTYQGYYTVNGSHVYNADLTVNGKKVDGTKVTTLDVANRLTVKGNIEVKPDIVGGNIGLGYTYTYTDKNSQSQETDFEDYGVGHSTGDTVRTDDLSINISLRELLEKEIPDGQQTMTFKVWDKTDGSTEGVDSNNITINIPVNVVLRDSEAPNAYIKPFHWTSSTDNSLYENSLANGHIDLEGDLPAETFKTNNTDVYDIDPKVSGKIIVDGYATDNVIVKKLKMKLPGYNSDNEFDIATRQNDGSWKSEAGTNSPWSFELVSDEYADDGLNTVTFKVMIDTENAIANTAAADVGLCLYAVDRGSAGLTTGGEVAYGSYSGSVFTAGEGIKSTLVNTQTTTATNTSYYKMDVVPYIKGVERNSGYNTHRSGMGLYPLIRGEQGNSITGFNLKGTSGIMIGSVPVTIEDSTTNTIKFSIKNTDNTYYNIVDGGIQVTNQVVSLNNVNNNSVEYNSEAVSTTDTRWTDDRFASIWECDADDKFAAKYPTYPSMDMGSNGDLFMSYTFYSKSVVYYNQLLSTTLNQIFTCGDQPEETDIMVNGVNDINVIYQANHHNSGGQGNWTANTGSGAGSINLYNASAPNCTSYAQGRYWRFEGFWHNQLLQQHKNAKVATSGNNIYHTIWYDKITHAIKYSNVESNATTKANTYNASTSNGTNSGARGYPEIGWVVIDGDADMDDIIQMAQRTTSGYNGGESNYPNNNWENAYLNGKSTTMMYSVALGKTKAQKEAIMNTPDNATRKNSAIQNNGSYNIYDYTGAGTGNEGYNYDCYENVDPCSVCGQYAAIAVTSDGYPIIVYYDVDHNMLKVARGMGTDPKGLNTINNNDNASLWRVQEVSLTSGHLGNDANYIGAVIDGNGYLHIVFQNSRGQLIYTRSTNTTSELSVTQGFTFNNGSVIVDENGTWADITLDSDNVPHISYMAGTSGYDTLKLAYCTAESSWTNALNWETVYAPMNAKSSNVKTCVVARPTGKTGGQTTSNTTSYWKAGIGFSTEEDYRVMKYIGSGTKDY